VHKNISKLLRLFSKDAFGMIRQLGPSIFLCNIHHMCKQLAYVSKNIKRFACSTCSIKLKNDDSLHIKDFVKNDMIILLYYYEHVIMNSFENL
jgi:hypothetical protein